MPCSTKTYYVSRRYPQPRSVWNTYILCTLTSFPNFFT